MAETYAVKITTQAEEQMQEITHYIASKLKAPNAALNLLDALEDVISSFSEFPQRIALTEEEPWHSFCSTSENIVNTSVI
ncbi:type II toxin-antitoxin system RelE/ParE family toxin [Sporolactobacillus sp. Y61]|uniref:Type II toxin-antitoxin system RelE/ParE family toxin n=1 Tax=Sporolactobacillus sp. Y61 TaxID=3160863 RepID=A0AAU8IG39_9BACL